MHTTSQGIQPHLHFKVEIQSNREMEVLFLLGKQWILQGGKYSRGTRKLSLVLRFIWTSQQQPQFSPASVLFQQLCKIPKPQKLYVYTCRFLLLQCSGKGGRGAKTDGSCQPASNQHASEGVLFMETFRSSNHRRSLMSIGEEEFISCGPVSPSFKHLH